MYYSIINTTTYAEHLLGNETEGIVHSVYQNTVNLRFGTNLLALQTAGSPVSPLSLITELKPDIMSSLKVTPGDTVRIYENKIQINSEYASSSFSYKDVCVQDSFLTDPPSDFSSSVLCENIKKALPVLKTGGFQLLFTSSVSLDTLVLNAARNCLLECSDLFHARKYRDAAVRLTGMIGLGIGLTPSGDDFLCGVLAGLILLRQSEHPFALELHRCISLHLADTNDLSAAFLSCALNNHYSMAVKSLSSVPSADELIRLFGKIGHSSGMDTLCGVLYTLQLRF